MISSAPRQNTSRSSGRLFRWPRGRTGSNHRKPLRHPERFSFSLLVVFLLAILSGMPKIPSSTPKRKPKGTPRKIILRGHRWSIKDSQKLNKWINSLPAAERELYQLNKNEDVLGLCVYHQRTLWIPTEGDTKEHLDTILHEAIHGCTELDENAVRETAESLADLLWKLGWRKTG